MRAARVDRRWTSSSSSADATATASRTFYADYARLQGELATAEEAAVPDKEIEELAGKLDRPPAVRTAYPQAEVIVRLMHLAREDAEAWYALLFALAVEAATMSVLLIAETTTQHERRHGGKLLVENVLRPVPVKRSVPDIIVEFGKVADWMRERVNTGRSNNDDKPRRPPRGL
jgi:hypothetical protein